MAESGGQVSAGACLVPGVSESGIKLLCLFSPNNRRVRTIICQSPWHRDVRDGAMLTFVRMQNAYFVVSVEVSFLFFSFFTKLRLSIGGYGHIVAKSLKKS